MARPWQYTRSRRTMMQVVMWIILGATVGLAALVDRQRANPQNVALAPTISYQYLQLRPPLGWRAMRDHGQLIFREAAADPESDADETGRVMAIEQDRGINVKADIYLLTQAANLHGPPRDASLIYMCGQKGLLATVAEGAVLVDNQPVAPGWSLLACTVLPNGLGVTVQLHTPREPTGADSALVKAVARNMTPVAGPVPAVPAVPAVPRLRAPKVPPGTEDPEGAD